MVELNQAIGEPFECPICPRQHELRSNKNDDPMFFCSTHGASINIQSEAGAFLESHVAPSLNLPEEDGDGDDVDLDDENDSTEKNPWA